MKILVTGGAGYVGLHVTKMLERAGHQPFIFDNFSTGNRTLVGPTPLMEGDLLDSVSLETAFSRTTFDAVMHFAALASVPDSIKNPHAYYEQNVFGTLQLLRAMKKFGVSRLVFSSSAAVYGEPRSEVIDENHPTNPINPYGQTKRMVELILEDLSRLQGLKTLSFRYFNAAGADVANRIGEKHDPEHHLIPLIMKAVLRSKAEKNACRVNVFGQDFPTPDGSCVRDFVHVMDIAQAHIQGLERIDQDLPARIFNVGSETGFSVLQVLKQSTLITGHAISPNVQAPRPGDPARLVASSRLLRDTLGWKPRCSDLATILKSAWEWEQVLSGQN